LLASNHPKFCVQPTSILFEGVVVN